MEITSTLGQDTGFYKGIAKWLETTMTEPMAHWAAIVASSTGLMSAGVAALSLPLTAAVSAIKQGAKDLLQGAEAYLIPDLINPNIEGIPISSSSIKAGRECDVSEAMVIVQSGASKEYRTDNVVPRLMEWQIDGYITSMSDINKNYNKPALSFGGPDSYTLIKPTLVLQKMYLDACQCSRRPVWFKTDEGRFKLAQITSLNTEHTAAENNAVHVQITLKEFNPYIIKTAAEDKMAADEISEEELGGLGA